LWSDAKRIELGINCEIVGMSEIKRRRIEEIDVDCHPGTKVGQYVPSYFCPRSVMLYILYQANHPDLTYRGGQIPIIHLQMDMHEVIKWANASNVRWAFSNVNAGAYYAHFHASLDKLNEINWGAIAETDFRRSDIKNDKQAEFLLFDYLPWSLIEKIGVINGNMLNAVNESLKDATYKPLVSIESNWYF
jgi:hypothetical protein